MVACKIVATTDVPDNLTNIGKAPSHPKPPPPTPTPGSDKEQCGAKITHRCPYCSVYGVSFLTCVTKSVPVLSRNLEQIRNIYPGFSMAEDEMMNNNKRALLYYYYITTIYHIRGHNNRKPLPKCLLDAIHGAYPDPNNNYTGYKPKENHDDTTNLEL
jgi:hypothetical protein